MSKETDLLSTVKVQREASVTEVEKGEYAGVWCANSVSFETPSGKVDASSGDVYCKGSVSCVVMVSPGKFAVRTA